MELKRKREKTTAELKEARAGKREADKRCRLMEEEKETICDDYEGRLQQQVWIVFCVRTAVRWFWSANRVLKPLAPRVWVAFV